MSSSPCLDLRPGASELIGLEALFYLWAEHRDKLTDQAQSWPPVRSIE